ncbi:YtxH domain-containing protein [Streptomyces sp. NPDC001781]
MRYRLTFVAGLAVGYVLGARAGQQRYEQIKKAARGIAQNPAVRNSAETAAQHGKVAAQQGKVYAGKALHTMSEKVGDHVPESFTDRVRARLGRNGHGRPAEDDWGTSHP